MMAFLSLAPTVYAALKTNNDNTIEAEQISHTLYFSKEDQFGGPRIEPVAQFDCSEKIFSVVELSNYPLGRHQLSVTWKDPTDNTREHTQYDFFVHHAETKIWAWLSLSRAAGAAMMTWINPAAGLEEFVGPWNVELRIDNKKIDDGSFTVIC